MAVLAVAAGLLVWRHATEPSPRPVAWRDVPLAGAQLPKPAAATFRSRAALEGALERAMPGRAPRVPAIDFSRDIAVLLAPGPRSATGYGVRVLSVTDEGGRVVVLAREETPGLGDPVTARLTYPHRLIVIPRTDKTVTIRWQGRP